MRLYNDYSSYLKNKYGCRVYRIALDAGFSCPNRDGTKGRGGCLYCNEDGSRAAYSEPQNPVEKQLSDRIEHLKRTKDAKKFIAYFQAFTNTYGPVDALKSVYDKVLPFKDIVGISIGTRPDSIDREKLSLIASYKDRYEVWLEYGLQSIHDKTLTAMNRGHNYKDFTSALTLTREFGILVSCHVIIGLPGESRQDIMETAEKLTELKIDGVKIHLLHILKGSQLETMYREGKVRLLEREEYVELACDFLERLSNDIVIQRLTGEGPRESHVAPDWALDKTGTINRIRETLERRKSCQGVKVASVERGA